MTAPLCAPDLIAVLKKRGQSKKANRLIMPLALWPAVFDVKDPDETWFRRNTFPGLQNNSRVVSDPLEIIDGMLSDSTFIAGPTLTLADISAYEELGQNQKNTPIVRITENTRTSRAGLSKWKNCHFIQKHTRFCFSLAIAINCAVA